MLEGSALVASASRGHAQIKPRAFHGGVLRVAARKMFSPDGLREPCPRRSIDASETLQQPVR
ncbi:hypothetical protein BN2476_750158 [Paraburkholderia piptadeniae]|uniref:Uncharacterized protein n=1 Tax=Paraburkholderia piptadeniae TaxID=1701573 RepID=A0A1N7SRX5_9BURK|nr:hypothetical protein BN2476_750158 [Paraburkholderia piptadeniae]